MAVEMKVFKSNAINLSSVQENIARFINGRKIVDITVKHSLLSVTSTIIVEDAELVVKQPKPPNAGKGYGRSRYRGVSWDKTSGKWRAMIGFNGKRHSAGRYDTEYEAALAYDEKARELMGPAAYTNFDY